MKNVYYIKNYVTFFITISLFVSNIIVIVECIKYKRFFDVIELIAASIMLVDCFLYVSIKKYQITE